jgi:hypothetical protein
MKKTGIFITVIAIVAAISCQGAFAAQQVVGGIGPFGVEFYAGTSPYQTMKTALPMTGTDENGQFTAYRLDFSTGSITFVRYQKPIQLDSQMIIGQLFPATGVSENQRTIDGQAGFTARGYSAPFGNQINIGAYLFDARTVVMLAIVGLDNQQYFNDAVATLHVSSSGRVASAAERMEAIGNAYLASSGQWSKAITNSGQYGYNTGNNFGPEGNENDNAEQGFDVKTGFKPFA